MLCKTCQSIDFSKSDCSPEDGGAKHHKSYGALKESATDGCELCHLIVERLLETTGQPEMIREQVLCNIWNWYDGPKEVFKGSATIIFYCENEGYHNGAGWDVIFGLVAEEDSVAATEKIVSGRKAEPTANSKPCFDLAKHWIANCLEHHSSSCPFDSTAALPSRVLDVGGESSQIKLFESNRVQGAWISLSHCWGRSARFVTATTNLSDRVMGIDIEELPPTFRDAVIITRKLGYRYLWIDSLCILQDSYQDWVDESGRMQNYYSQAVLTIASDLASGDHEGFLEDVRDKINYVKVPFNRKSGLDSGHVFVTKEVKTPGILPDQTHLSVRGWTLQEDVLSPRTLHYTSKELIFECQKLIFSETDTTPQGYNESARMTSVKRFFLRPESGFDDPMLLQYPHYKKYYEPISRWYRLFEDYCSRLLTFESDRLAAIAGLAREIQRQTKYSYKAGIWMEDMHSGLLWATHGRGKSAAKYRAPSWSWAALDIIFRWGMNVNPNYQVYMHVGNWARDTDSHHTAEILECKVEPVNGDPFGELMGGHLRLRGHVLSLMKWKGSIYVNTFWREVVTHQRSLKIVGHRASKSPDQLICDFDITPEYDGSENEQVEEVDDTENSVEEEEGEDEETYDEEEEPRLEGYPANVEIFQIARHENSNLASEKRKKKAVFFCLMLVPANVEGDVVTYRRVGIAEVPDIDGLGDDGWETKEIIVI